MNLKQLIYITLAVILAACSEDTTVSSSTVGAADNAIVLYAGISKGGDDVQTRAVANPDANHTSHLALDVNTQLRLKVDGTWKGKADCSLSHGAVVSGEASQLTTATIGEGIKVNAEDVATHNAVIFTTDEQLYWDDYGTADLNNMPTSKGGKVSDGSDGRTKGLDILAVAINGKTAAPEVSSWTALSWDVGTPENGVISHTGGWSEKDLLVCNNVKYNANSELDNAYKFDDRAAGKLLEFTHAMSKITVNLTAGAGFKGGTFVNKPTVTLLGFNYTGTVDVASKTSTPGAGTANIDAQLVSGGASSPTAQYDALVFPGNTITNIATDYILELNADGNIYQVNGTKLYEKMTAISHGYVIKQGVNYVLNITVNKTGINVTATIKDWTDVTAENDAPVISVTHAYGYDGTQFSTDKSFSFLRSTTKNAGYSKDAQMDYTSSSSTCALTPMLYWPDHNTHFFFRATWPVIAGSGTYGEYIPNDKFTGDNAIAVVNEKFNAGHYPSEMMLGYPRVSDGDATADETCKAGHKEADGTTPTPGICATQGNINMDFRYAMSQVIVELKTNEEVSATNKVTFDGETKVEIIGGYTSGKLMLADGASDFTGETVGPYVMNNKADDDYDSFHDAVIPQALTNDSGDLRFRITVKTGTTLDKYETVLGIKSIKVNGDQTITSWEPGKKYTYTLTITKTGIQVTATVKDWIAVTASDNIWF